MSELAPQPPRARIHPSSKTCHGQQLTDFYAWLRDDNWQQVMQDPAVLDPEIRAYLEAENAYAEAMLKPTEALAATLFEEMKARIKQDDASVPSPDGDYAYFRKYVEGGQHPHVCRQPVKGGATEVLLDGDREAAGQKFFKLAGVTHSPDHQMLAYGIDLNGSEIYTIKFRDLQTGRDLDASITGAHGPIEWGNDNRTVYYTVLDDNHRPCAVFRHQLGSDPGDDQEIYREPDPGFFVSIGKTESRAFILIQAHDHQTSEVHLIDADRADAKPVIVEPRTAEHEYEVSHHGDQLIVLTNADGAEDFKIMTTPVARPGRENWQEFIAHEPGRLLLGLQVFQDFWVRMERVEGLPQIIVTEFESGAAHAISFDEAAYSLGLAGGYAFATTQLRFIYSSMTTPERTFDYDMAERSRILRKEQEVPSGHNPDDYVTTRLFARAVDGAEVPISVLHAKTTLLDGSAPLLLYGYGSYGHAIPAAFSTARLSLVDRGFVYAIAHIRGGMEKGYGWYKAGKRESKKNTFSDFIGAADHLIEAGYTSKGKIAAHGGSAGGLLMGVVANWAPELFAACVAEVPFVDVLTTMGDTTLPLTPPEWTEWGNPIEDKAAFTYIKSYSPYDNVCAQAYPALFITAGLTDPRVTYWEPAKWTAKLRALKTDDNLLVLKTNMDAGHGGAAGRFDRLQETAAAYAFVITQCGA
ncbi:MAG: S9 family peptidase [Rhodospirillales bacterium]|nr:S9 family peptidase [Rhodospirillales bacterium]